MMILCLTSLESYKSWDVAKKFSSLIPGDEIFSINSVPVQGMTHQEAIGLFKEVKKGPVVVTIGRRTSTASVTASNLSIKTVNISSQQFTTTNESEE